MASKTGLEHPVKVLMLTELPGVVIKGSKRTRQEEGFHL